MGLFSKLAKAGIAKKAFDEARKPHNQAKIRQFVAKMSNRRTRRAGHPY
jgi:hypothetical protein